MRGIFWNLGTKGKRETRALELLPGLVSGLQPDLLVLAESPEGGARLEGFERADPMPSARGLKTHYRETALSVRALGQGSHYSAYEIAAPRARCSLNLVTVHLQSPLHDRGEQARARKRAQRCREFIEDLEHAAGNTRTIILGDFNMDPFAAAMLDIDGLNAVSTRERAARSRTSEGTTTRTLYNPCWSLLGDRPGPAGTFFVNNDGPAGCFWHVPDQLLIRGELAGFLSDVRVVDRVGELDLVSARARKPALSDHLPLAFELDPTIWSSHP